jgi:hypothetical protein
MKIKVYVVDVDLSARQKKIIRAGVVTGAVIAALGLGLAIAAPHQWSTNDPLKATDLNGLNVVSYASDAGTASYSVGATKFCGATTTTFTGALGGYAGAKQQCQGTCSTPTAHMCLTDELIRSQALGVDLSTVSGWYAAGGYVLTSAPAGFIQSDCGGSGTTAAGYTQTTSNDPSYTLYGAVWEGNEFDSEKCTTSHPIMCCD